MRLPTWSLPALVLLADTQQAAASTIFSPTLLPRYHLSYVFKRAEDIYESAVQRRTPQNQQPSASGADASNDSSSGSLQMGTDATEVNSTVSDACMQKLAGLTSVSNVAGFAGCYNILEFDPATTQFQSDLRIYAKSDPTGQFAGLARNDILVLLNFPSSTSFKTLTRRAVVELVGRQDAGNNTEIQQFSLSGSITTPLNLGKLNELQMAALLTPQIALQATTGGQTLTANMASDDMAFFVTGEFPELTGQAKEVTDPAIAANAIAATKGFVLPGTTFGIFPVGLIVTSAWTFLFVLAYGAGTVMRFRYRSAYRKRAAMMAGTTYGNAGVGKL